MEFMPQWKPSARVHAGFKFFLVGSLILGTGNVAYSFNQKPNAAAPQSHPVAPAGRPAPQMRGPANTGRPANTGMRPPAAGGARPGMGQGANAPRSGAGTPGAQRPGMGGASRPGVTAPGASRGGTMPGAQGGAQHNSISGGAQSGANRGIAGSNNRGIAGGNTQAGAGRGAQGGTQNGLGRGGNTQNGAGRGAQGGNAQNGLGRGNNTQNGGNHGVQGRGGQGSNAQNGRGGQDQQHSKQGNDQFRAGNGSHGELGGGAGRGGMGAGKTTKVAGGGTRTTFSNGGSLTKSAGGRPTEYHNAQSGVHGTFDHSGHLATIRRDGPNGSHMEVRRGAGNERRIDTVRPVRGGVEHVVSYGHGRGYYERPIVGRPGYVQRTVIVGGRSYGVVYHQYFYHGVYLYSPVPAVVFAPAYYGWLMTPWSAPVVYAPAAWGWVGQPWYGYYGAAFVPYPAYYAPDLWLTDYLIAASLQQAYEDQQAAAAQAYAATQAAYAPPPPPPQITDDEKALIDQDVKAEVARQQQAVVNNSYSSDAQGGVQQQGAAMQTPEALQDHLFTVFAAPVEAKVGGGTCDLAEGDMLFRKGEAPNSDNTIDVVVKTSHADSAHPGFCSQQAAIRVQLADLQEMYNHKKELLAEGMQKQASLMGKKHGMPKGPKAQPTENANGQAEPDDQAVAELKQQILEGDSSEAEVRAATNPGS